MQRIPPSVLSYDDLRAWRNGNLRVGNSERELATDEMIGCESEITQEACLYAGPGYVALPQTRVVSAGLKKEAKQQSEQQAKQSPPVSPLNQTASSSTTLSAAASVSDTFRPVSTQGVHVLPLQVLPKGTKVVFRPVPQHPDVYEVQVIEDNIKHIPGMQETSLGVKAGVYGFVSRHYVQKSNDVKEYYKGCKSGTDLFNPEVPDLRNHIAQKKLGNCFFLASLLSVLNVDPEGVIIRNMMRKVTDDKNDYTLVRLYSPYKLKPIVYQLDNTVYHRHERHLLGDAVNTIFLRDTVKDDETIAHTALWVHMLEKAFIFHSVSQAEYNDPDSIRFNFPSFRTMYGAGGKPELALSVLTGKRASTFIFPQLNTQKQQGSLDTEVWKGCCCGFYSTLKGFKALYLLDKKYVVDIDNFLMQLDDEKLSSLRNEFCAGDAGQNIVLILQKYHFNPALLQDIEPREKEDIKNYVQQSISQLHDRDYRKSFCKQIGGMRNAAFIGSVIDSDKINDTVSHSLGKLTTLTMEEACKQFDTIFNGLKSNSADDASFNRAKSLLKNVLLNGVDRKEVMTGADRRYSIAELKMYCTFKNMLENQHALVAGTREKKGDEDWHGLHPTHAYAMIDFEFEESSGLIYVYVQNPWGHTGRHDKWDKGHQKILSEKMDDFQSRIEFHQFLDMFSHCVHVDLTDLIKKPVLAPDQDLKAARAIIGLVKKKPVNPIQQMDTTPPPVKPAPPKPAHPKIITSRMFKKQPAMQQPEEKQPEDMRPKTPPSAK